MRIYLKTNDILEMSSETVVMRVMENTRCIQFYTKHDHLETLKYLIPIDNILYIEQVD